MTAGKRGNKIKTQREKHNRDVVFVAVMLTQRSIYQADISDLRERELHTPEELVNN